MTKKRTAIAIHRMTTALVTCGKKTRSQSKQLRHRGGTSKGGGGGEVGEFTFLNISIVKCAGLTSFMCRKDHMEHLNSGHIFLQWFLSSLCVSTGCNIPRSKARYRVLGIIIHRTSMVPVVVVSLCIKVACYHVPKIQRYSDQPAVDWSIFRLFLLSRSSVLSRYCLFQKVRAIDKTNKIDAIVLRYEGIFHRNNATLCTTLEW